MKKNFNYSSIFALSEYSSTCVKLVDQNSHSIELNNEIFNTEIEWISYLLFLYLPSCLILDVRSNLSRLDLESIKRNGLFIISLDDISDRRLACDFNFYPPVPQAYNLCWNSYFGEYFIGWEWIVMRTEFTERLELTSHKLNLIDNSLSDSIIITCGASDPGNYTQMILQSLDQLKVKNRILIAIGSDYMHTDTLDILLQNLDLVYEIYVDDDSFLDICSTAGIAIASFGNTAYELCALNIPSIFLSLTNDHSLSASYLSHNGLALNAGVPSTHSSFFINKLNHLILYLLHDHCLRKRIRHRLTNLSRPLGTQNISNFIAELQDT